MEDDEKKSSRGGGILLILLLPVFYVLSTGPVVKWVMINPSKPHPVVTRIYAPLEWFFVKAPPLQRPLDAYLDWWRRL